MCVYVCVYDWRFWSTNALVLPTQNEKKKKKTNLDLLAGGRRGAQMGTFDVGHPDVMEFIRAKREDGRLRQFNLSLLITDEFMQAVINEDDWKLAFPVTQKEVDQDGLDPQDDSSDVEDELDVDDPAPAPLQIVRLDRFFQSGSHAADLVGVAASPAVLEGRFSDRREDLLRHPLRADGDEGEDASGVG